MPRLLIADDDMELCHLLQQYFEMEGMELHSVHDGNAVLPALEQSSFDLLILDIMLPGQQGLDVLRQVRRSHTTPVLMLTARGEEMDRIIGLELGADDYLPKPSSPRELVARVRSILRRSQITQEDKQTAVVLRVADLELNSATRQVFCAEQKILLTGAEFSVLQELMRLPGQVIDKNDLFQRALGRRQQAFDRSLDMHISNLRKKLGAHPDGSARITAVRGAGYVLTLAGKS
ncbi:MAG: response regulator transcription factor [Rhodoferax sp.]|nr:response regulator transcription factor [Rhodoferax sp.]MCF8208556.1 response regulator transcription factor [Rhodoferax sp.]